MRLQRMLGILVAAAIIFQGATVVQAGSVKKMALITKVTDSQGKKYLSVDFINMLGINEALKRPDVMKAAEKDGSLQKDENGYFFYDDYYVYNSNSRVWKLTADAKIIIKVCDFQADSPASTWKTISLDTFAKGIKDGTFSGGLFYIYQDAKNHKVTLIKQQYTP